MASRARSDRRGQLLVARDIKLGGASPGQQALKAGLCDEILIHLAPHLLGDGVRLFDHLGGPLPLEKISAADGPLATACEVSGS
jgi:dihydrofolate reductase